MNILGEIVASIVARTKRQEVERSGQEEKGQEPEVCRGATFRGAAHLSGPRSAAVELSSRSKFTEAMSGQPNIASRAEECDPGHAPPILSKTAPPQLWLASM